MGRSLSEEFFDGLSIDRHLPSPPRKKCHENQKRAKRTNLIRKAGSLVAGVQEGVTIKGVSAI
jgi:hypothetical protein